MHDHLTGFWRKQEPEIINVQESQQVQKSNHYKNLKEFEAVKADIINTQYLLNELVVQKDRQRIKCRAQEGGNAVDWGEVKDGL